jgi:uncharacterized protein (DUF952 family)
MSVVSEGSNLSAGEIFHITSPEVWRRATTNGSFTESTRGRSLKQVGFIHCSFAEQVRTVANFLYPDRKRKLLLLTIDPARVPAEIRTENLDGGLELFPHIYGELPLDAVIAVHTVARDNEEGWVLPEAM